VLPSFCHSRRDHGMRKGFGNKEKVPEFEPSIFLG
jgi:hypothetical protein